MLLEPLRCATDWLKDPIKGVGALAAAFPRDPDEEGPAALALITDETRDPFLAIGTAPGAEQLPCLVGSLRPLGSAPHLEPGSLSSALTHGVVSTFWQYVERYDVEGGRSADRIVADAYRYFRALLKSFHLLHQEGSARVRLGCEIIGCEGFLIAPWFRQVEHTLLIGACEVRFTVRDSWTPT